MVELTTKDKVRRLLIALVVVACGAGAVVAVGATREVDQEGNVVVDRDDPCDVEVTGSGDPLPACDPSDEPVDELVERFFPAREAQALQQVQVGVDLRGGYTGALVVDGVEVPESQLQRRPELNQVLFAPGEGQVLEEWPPGRNCVQAIVWPIGEGRSSSRTIGWCFEIV